MEPGSFNVSMEQRVLHVNVVEQFLRSEIPLAKVDLRSVLEETALRLSHSSYLLLLFL